MDPLIREALGALTGALPHAVTDGSAFPLNSVLLPPYGTVTCQSPKLGAGSAWRPGLRKMKGIVTTSLCLMFVAAWAPCQGNRTAQSERVNWAPPEPRTNRTSPQKIELGRFLFESKDLSDNGRVSCATCHDPARSFVDHRADSVGILDIGIGRNSPTLFGIGHVALFRDPDQARTARPGKRPLTLSLEDRCLKPLENELEMGASIKATVKRLRKIEGMNARFDEVFGGRRGVDRDRLGKALAAFVRTLELPRAPYRRFLDGDQNALDSSQRKGLALFESLGCVNCHGGPGMSDGLMHVVDPPHGFRMRGRQREAAKRRTELMRRDYEKRDPAQLAKLTVRQLAEEAEKMAARLPGGGGYDASQLEVQTATLWDVARTAPYFRDGTIKTLEEAITLHVRELLLVREEQKEVRKTLKQLGRQGKRAPKKMRPSGDPAAHVRKLSPEEVQALCAFLEALSPPS